MVARYFSPWLCHYWIALTSLVLSADARALRVISVIYPDLSLTKQWPFGKDRSGQHVVCPGQHRLSRTPFRTPCENQGHMVLLNGAVVAGAQSWLSAMCVV